LRKLLGLPWCLCPPPNFFVVVRVVSKECGGLIGAWGPKMSHFGAGKLVESAVYHLFLRTPFSGMLRRVTFKSRLFGETYRLHHQDGSNMS
jgi:hypothetical protein